MFSEFFVSTYSETNTAISSHTVSEVRPNNLSPTLISVDSVLELLGKVDINKNGGPDGIPNIFLRHTSEHLAKPLTIIFNKSLSDGIFPIKFKTANITPIFKKGDKSDVKNYRPICLLNSFSKIFERLVYNILLSSVENMIDVGQHGFIKDRSALTNLSLYTNFLARALDDGHEVHSIYTDFKKAFDTVNINILLKKLSDMGINGNLLKWIESYLKGRQLRVVFMGGRSDVFTPNSGVPQGSVLGPLLFAIFINDLGRRLICKYLLFADDLKMYWIIKNDEDIRLLQEALNQLAIWCVENDLKLNVSKCNAICFSNKYSPTPPTYTISDVTLNQVTTIRDLGIIFDNKLKFDVHIESMVNTAYKMLGFITRTTKNFNNVKCINYLYNSLVRSRLEYLTQIWSPYQITYDFKIERVQRRFTRYTNYVSGHNYDEYNQRLISLNYLSLNSRRKYYDMCLLHRILNTNGLSYLSDQLVFRNVEYPSRYNPLFRPQFSRTNYGFHMDIVCRLQSEFNNYFGDLDILNLSYTSFKKLTLQKLTSI